MPCKPYASGATIAQVLELSIVPLKADLQALACPSKYHNSSECLLMPIKDARSDDYAPGT